MRLLVKARRSFSSEYSPVLSMISATAFSKYRARMPVAPTLPISSLSARMQQQVYLGVSVMRNMASISA